MTNSYTKRCKKADFTKSEILEETSSEFNNNSWKTSLNSLKYMFMLLRMRQKLFLFNR